MMKTRRGFKLSVTEGSFNDSQIIVMLGENGTGKTTFSRMLAEEVKPDQVVDKQVDMPAYTISYKRQELMSNYSSTVRDLLHEKIPGSCTQAQFKSDVMKLLKIEELMDRQVANLSCGELQRVKLCLCLGKPADIYLIDEPSAHLDSQQRLLATKVIKRFILHQKKTAFVVVEHDFIMAAYLADKVVVFEGKPSDCSANAPEPLASGMNRFLSQISVTEMRMLWWICGHTRNDRIRNEDIRDRVGVAPIEEKLVQHRLRWFGHIQRRPPEAPVHCGIIRFVDNIGAGGDQS